VDNKVKEQVKKQKTEALAIKEWIEMPAWTTIIEPELMQRANDLNALLVDAKEMSEVVRIQAELKAIRSLIASIIDRVKILKA